MKRAFTLVELLIVISIIGLLATIVVPSLVHARLLGYQTRCAANQRDVVQACLFYAQDATVHRGTVGQALPAIDVTQDNWSDMPGGNAGCLWLLVSREYTAREVFLCPEAGSSHNWEAPGRGATGFSRDDTAGTTTLSYSYLSQVPYVHNGSTYNATPADQANSSLVILADKNPYLTLAEPTTFQPEPQASVDNHDGRGRNVGRLDGSATWVESVTVNGDNVYQSEDADDPDSSNENGIRDEMNDSFCLP